MNETLTEAGLREMLDAVANAPAPGPPALHVTAEMVPIIRANPEQWAGYRLTMSAATRRLLLAPPGAQEEGR